ncbi:MAG: hypothetical protein LQ343_000830 [Gyalolechia ehrenbergii]|nr:MAG: hypothetical protein LQ343_000830 [Gyalolechia ehrenbergii]
MTVDVTIPQETQSLVCPLQRTFYPTKIPPTHHQLKNFISTTDHDIIYYASEHDIYALHLSTRKRESIASLPWKPQCLDARHGWICVGGQSNGRCAFVSINGKESIGGRGSFSRHEAEVDALLPLDLDPESRMLAHSYFQRLRASSPSSQSKPEVQIHELGGSIMNSVVIHRLQSDQKDQDDEIVCVMTNNDCTVRIYSLSRSRLLDTLHFSTGMNHASISPDSQLLIAVGDEPKAFFCRRVPKSAPSARGNQGCLSLTWQVISELKLNPAASNDACFTTAFSPSGHICAVAQQSGIVTVYDTSKIQEDMEDEDAVVEVLRSSRECLNGDYTGAVRSMSFSPAPWDLLAWAEDRGRICVTDLRTSCRSRQTVDLELDSPRLNRAGVTDVEDGQTTSEQRQLEIERRFLQRHREALNAQNDLASVSHVADYIEFSAARRRLQRDTAPVPGDFNDLTEGELQMLESIRASRSQENVNADLEHDTQRPFSVSYLHDQRSDSPETQLHTASSANSPSASAQIARLESMRDAMRRNHLDRSRAADRGSYQPRRRSSVVISSSTNSSNQSSSSHPSSLAPVGSSVPTLSASPSRLASVVASGENAEDNNHTGYESSDAWRTVADAMGSPHFHASSETDSDPQRRQRREDGTRDSASAGTMFRLLQQQHFQQQQAARLQRLRSNQAPRSRQLQALDRAMSGERGYEGSELDMLRRLADPGFNAARREHGVTTMGIGWHEDGRRL